MAKKMAKNLLLIMFRSVVVIGWAPPTWHDGRSTNQRFTKGAPMGRSVIRLLVGHPTTRGPVFVGQSQNKRFHVMWKGESLGAYGSLVQAVDDAAGGHTFTPSDGIDLGSLDISDDAAEWLPWADLDQ